MSGTCNCTPIWSSLYLFGWFWKRHARQIKHIVSWCPCCGLRLFRISGFLIICSQIFLFFFLFFGKKILHIFLFTLPLSLLDTLRWWSTKSSTLSSKVQRELEGDICWSSRTKLEDKRIAGWFPIVENQKNRVEVQVFLTYENANYFPEPWPYSLFFNNSKLAYFLCEIVYMYWCDLLWFLWVFKKSEKDNSGNYKQKCAFHNIIDLSFYSVPDEIYRKG